MMPVLQQIRVVTVTVFYNTDRRPAWQRPSLGPFVHHGRACPKPLQNQESPILSYYLILRNPLSTPRGPPQAAWVVRDVLPIPAGQVCLAN